MSGPAPPRASPAVPVVISNHGLRHSGGIEAYLRTLVHGLHARGIRPTVVAKKFDRSMEEFGWVDAVPVSMLGVPGKLRDRWFDLRLRRLKARRGWFPLIALNQTAAADIAVCGSNHPAHLAAMGRERPGLADRWKITLERAHLERSRVIVAHSRLLAGQVVAHYGIAPQKIVVAHPPVDTARFSRVSDAHRAVLRERLGLPTDRAVFLLASTGHARKGLDLAVRAVAMGDRPACLVVAGRPPGVEAPQLRYLGYRSDIEDVYRAVDATLMCSRYEPFGLVGVESVCCGTPVVVEAGAGCAEVLQGSGALPFRLDTAGSLEAAVDRAVTRWQAGTLRVHEPAAALGYDPSVQAHLDILLDWVQRLRDDIR